MEDRRNRFLTERQKEIYEWIFAETKKNGFQPSFRDVQAHLGFSSPNAVASNIKPLQKKGFIELGDTKSRSIRFILKPDGTPFRGFNDI